MTKLALASSALKFMWAHQRESEATGRGEAPVSPPSFFVFAFVRDQMTHSNFAPTLARGPGAQALDSIPTMGLPTRARAACRIAVRPA